MRHTLKQWVLQFEFIPSGVHLCRVTPIENLKSLPYYDEEKHKEITLDAAETVLGFLALIGLLTVISRITGEVNGVRN